MIRVRLVLLIALVLVIIQSALAEYPKNETYMQISDQLWNQSGGNLTSYEYDIKYFVWNHGIYRGYPTNVFKSPNLTWDTSSGLCGDFAVLELDMLRYHGVKAELYGVYSEDHGKHMTVLIQNNPIHTIDDKWLKNYTVLSVGLPQGYSIQYEYDEPKGNY